jgi:predicted exporter
LQEAGSSVTPAILIGGLTTAVAFFAAAGTEFLGLAELGLIAGAGILLCLLSTLLVLPALISLLSPFESGAPPAPLVRIDRWMAGCWRYPRLTVLMGFAVTLGFSGGLPRAFFDHNLLHLQAKGLESVTWEQRLLEETQRSAWFAISLADSGESLRQKKRQFEQLDAVERVEEIASLVPENVLQRSMIVGRIHDRLASLPSGMPVLTPLTPEQLAAESSQLGPVLPTADGVTPTAEELNVWRTRLVVQLWQSLQPLRQMAETAPPTFADLPAALRARFLGKHGTQLLRVYGRGDIWQRDVLQRFVEQIQRVDPQVTGHPLQAFYASRQMQRSYLKAAGWSAVGVLLMLAVYLRRLDLVLLAVLPTALGMVQLLGLLGWLGIPLNPANLIVLPLIIGIGIDDGVHVIHELRARPRQSSLSAPTAAGIVITSLTSMIGFGTLILARHEGLRSLGRVVTLGIACCLGTSALLLPCLVRLVGREAPPTRER